MRFQQFGVKIWTKLPGPDLLGHKAKYSSPEKWLDAEDNIIKIGDNIIQQVASDTANLLLKIQKQNTQTLQLFAKIIKMESI
jgi:hypothetical protein